MRGQPTRSPMRQCPPHPMNRMATNAPTLMTRRVWWFRSRTCSRMHWIRCPVTPCATMPRSGAMRASPHRPHRRTTIVGAPLVGARIARIAPQRKPCTPCGSLPGNAGDATQRDNADSAGSAASSPIAHQRSSGHLLWVPASSPLPRNESHARHAGRCPAMQAMRCNAMRRGNGGDDVRCPAMRRDGADNADITGNGRASWALPRSVGIVGDGGIAGTHKGCPYDHRIVAQHGGHCEPCDAVAGQCAPCGALPRIAGDAMRRGNVVGEIWDGKRVASTQPQAQKTLCSRDRVPRVIAYCTV